jgi:hypothetical protein
MDEMELETCRATKKQGNNKLILLLTAADNDTHE